VWIGVEVIILERRILPPSLEYSCPTLKIDLIPHRAAHNYERRKY
jgi:hypothetical protein